MLKAFCFAIILGSCGSSDRPKHNEQLPFIGTRYFETRPLAAGKATPFRKVEIKENGTVIFSFASFNTILDIKTDSGSYKAGPFKKIVDCRFVELDNDIRHYEITQDTIFETDSSGIRIALEDCCRLTDSISNYCPCEGLYVNYTEQTW
jgi:hypothetical protein